jgi:hypothetical protein
VSVVCISVSAFLNAASRQQQHTDKRSHAHLPSCFCFSC